MTDEDHIAAGHIRVQCVDKTCFWVRSDLKPISLGCYDPWCFSDPLTGAKTMEWHDWSLRSRPELEQSE